ncbi:MAG: GntR family transcriptional regulator [Acidobacteria bacterium]|nr:GntR family transcriptional regulator [Acidobacteriota bacterium]
MMSITSSLNAMGISSTQDSVVAAIQNAIFSGELKLGQRILEEELSARLKISRATLREALRRLEQLGLVQIIPRRGTFVTRMTLSKIERACRLRAVLEGFAARYACERLEDGTIRELELHIEAMRQTAESGDMGTFLQHDRDFHARIWQLADDEYLEYILKYLSTPYFAIIATISAHIFSDPTEVYREHERYLEVLRQRNPDLAQSQTQAIHERLAENIVRDIRRKRDKMPGSIPFIED